MHATLPLLAIAPLSLSNVTLLSFMSNDFASHGHHRLSRSQGPVITANSSVVTTKLWRDTADGFFLPRWPRRQPTVVLGSACLISGPICLC